MSIIPTQSIPNTKKNNISSNDNSPYNSQLLKHLIRYPLFKLGLISNKNSSKIYKGYIIKNDIIKTIKEKYALKKLYDYLDKNNILKGINYQNCDSNFPNIIKFLNEKNNAYLNAIKKIEKTEIPYIIKSNINSFSAKYINNKQSKLIYLNEFEIIDQEFGLYLQKLYKNNLYILPVNYILIEGKIILSIIFEQKYIHEIVYINPDGGDIIYEYIIEVLTHNNNNIPNDINSIMFQTFQKNGLNKIISSGKSVKVTDNITFNFHKINRIITITDSRIFRYGKGFNSINGSIPPSIRRNKSNFDKEIKKSLLFVSNIPDGYLVTKEFVKLMSPVINLDNNNAYYSQIMNNNNINDFNLIKIQTSSLTINNIALYYPINFDLMDKKTFDKYNKNEYNKIPKNLFEEIKYIQINGGFIFISKNNNFLFNNNNLLYLYSSKKTGLMQLNDPIAIIECKDVDDRYNKLSLINKELSNKNILNNPVEYFNKNNLLCHLIKSNNNINNTNEQKSKRTLNKTVPRIKNYSGLGKISLKSQNKISDISERLKVLLLLAISQKYVPSNNLEKIYLINPKWAEEYKYKEIKSLINQISNEILNKLDKSYDLNSLSTIIPLLNIEQLKLDEQKINSNNNKPFESISERIEFQDKSFDIFREFIIVNNHMLNLFQKYFQLTSSGGETFYLHKELEGDLIIIQNHKLYKQKNQTVFQNTLFAGIMNRDENIFDIKHILDYKDNNILRQEINVLLKCNYSSYLLDRTGLTSQNKKDMIVPIFNNNQIIGTYYRFNKNYNYKACMNYSFLLSNNQLWNIIYLYVNELSIKEKLKKINNNDEIFYLIKKDLLIDIKENNNYFQLKKFFDGKLNTTLPTQKDIYNIIKSLSQNQLIEFTNNLKQTKIQNFLLSFYEMEKTQIPNPNNKNESYIIFEDFEIIEKQIGDLLIKGKYPYNILTCSIVAHNMIIFHYPNNKFNNKYYMLVVSTIDENNNFRNEYLLIYFHPNYVQSHFNQIKYNIRIFFQTLSFINNNAPIVVNEYEEIGNIIKLSRTSEKDYFPPNPLNIVDTLKDFPCKPLIGLENIGATCYMNATLQCLCNIRKFVNYFKYHNNLEKIVKNDKKKEKLSSAFKLLIEKLYPYELSNNCKYAQNNQQIMTNSQLKMSYAPREFKDTISKMNQLFEGIQENDSKDLVHFLLMTLHKELNKVPLEVTKVSISNIFEKQRNKALMFTKFSENFTKTQQSIISDLFYGMNYNINKCANCKAMIYNYQIYFFLMFPLEEIRKFKLMSNNGFNPNFNYNNNIVDIYDCFNYDMKVNIMSGNNAMYCHYCKQTCNSFMRTILTTGPEVLIIILNRGKGNEFKVKIDFYLELDLCNYIELKDTGFQYELFGVITHLGESGMGGRYIAYCKSYWDNKWFKFDDAKVEPVKDFISEVIDFAMPYLLFYQKKNNCN